MGVDQRVAIVTGGSRGIGRAIAEGLGSVGYIVVVNYMGNQAKAEEVVASIKSKGGQSVALQADVSLAAEVGRLFDQTMEAFGRVDVLVNNAGITRDNLLLRLKEEDWDAVLDTNLKSMYLCAKHAAKIMMKQRFGRIVNISSVVGQMGNAGQANYSAAKAGALGLTKALAKELASRNVTVNAVAPGYIQTDMTSVLGDDLQQKLSEAIPLGRLGQPDDVAGAVLFLVSDQAAYITGQTINVDGGMVMS